MCRQSLSSIGVISLDLSPVIVGTKAGNDFRTLQPNNTGLSTDREPRKAHYMSHHRATHTSANEEGGGRVTCSSVGDAKLTTFKLARVLRPGVRSPDCKVQYVTRYDSYIVHQDFLEITTVSQTQNQCYSPSTQTERQHFLGFVLIV